MQEGKPSPSDNTFTDPMPFRRSTQVHHPQPMTGMGNPTPHPPAPPPGRTSHGLYMTVYAVVDTPPAVSRRRTFLYDFQLSIKWVPFLKKVRDLCV